MRKLILVSVVAAGCLSRFRNGTQFTKTAKEIEVDDSELAVLEADQYLQVKVIAQKADNTDAGAKDDNAGKDTANVSISELSSKDMPPDDIIIRPAPTSIIVDELENEPTPKADADTDTTAPDAADTDDTKNVVVSKAPDDHLATITEAMRGLNLDMSAGKPTVYDLQAMGLDISAKERDEAWDALVK